MNNLITYVPGANRAMILKDIGGFSIPVPAEDKKGRPVWNMPAPKYQVLHYKNRALKDNWLRTRTDVEEKIRNNAIPEDEKEATAELLRIILKKATVAVPIYAGCDAKTAQVMRRADRFTRAYLEAEQDNFDFDYDAAVKENEARHGN